MKIKAIMTLSYCSSRSSREHFKKCPYICNRDACESYKDSSCYKHIDDTCIWETETTKYIDKDVKDIEINRLEGFFLVIGKEVYLNDNDYSEIKYLEIDGKVIIRDYEEVKEMLED